MFWYGDLFLDDARVTGAVLITEDVVEAIVSE